MGAEQVIGEAPFSMRAMSSRWLGGVLVLGVHVCSCEQRNDDPAPPSRQSRDEGGQEVGLVAQPLPASDRGTTSSVIREGLAPAKWTAMARLGRGVDVPFSRLRALRIAFPRDGKPLKPTEGGDRVCVVFFCIDEAGHVEPHVSVDVKSNGCNPRRLARSMKDWRFEPHMEKGVPTAACTILPLERSD